MPSTFLRWLIAMSIVALGSVTLAACGGRDDEGSSGDTTAYAFEECDSAPERVMIGATLPMSGSGAPYGAVFAGSLEYAVDQINAAGGVAGQTELDLKVLDDKALAGPAVQNMRQLVDGDDAIAVVSGYNDPPLALATVGQQQGVPIFNGGGNGVELAGNPFLWNNVASVSQEAKRIYQYLADNQDYKKVAILAATNYTQEDIEGVETEAKAIFGDDNVLLVTYDPEVPDVRSQLQQISEFGPDGVHLLNSGTLTQTAAKNMSELGVDYKVIGTSGHFYEPGILKEPSMEGAYASAMEFEPDEKFAKEIEKKTGVPANAFQDNYASIVNVIAQSIEQLIDEGYCVNGEAINQVVLERSEAGEGFEGYAGEVTYTPEGGSARKLKILTVKDGEIQDVEAGKPVS